MAGMRTSPSLMARPRGMSMSQLSALQRARRRNRTRPMPGRTIYERDAADRMRMGGRVNNGADCVSVVNPRESNPRESNPCSIQKAGGKKWRCCSSGSSIDCDDITTIDPFSNQPRALAYNPRGGGGGFRGAAGMGGNPVTAVAGPASAAAARTPGARGFGFRRFGFGYPWFGLPAPYYPPYAYSPYTYSPYAYAAPYTPPYAYAGYPPVSAAYGPGYYNPWWRMGPRYSAAVIA